ncbi:ATP-binding protein, partial [Streptomyces niveus]
ADWIRVSVEDSHPYRPKALERDYAQTGGRGLLLVREITLEAGGTCDVEHTASGGKIVWALLPLTPDAVVVSALTPVSQEERGPATSPRPAP